MLILTIKKGVVKKNQKILMSVLQNSSLDLNIFYKNPNIPKIALDDIAWC